MTTLQGYKEREITYGEWSEVYYNLHQHCFSMKQGGLVVLHSESIILENVKFSVGKKGRQSVLESGVKQVHAYVRGNFTGTEVISLEGFREGYYNPFHYETFIDKESDQPLHKADLVVLTNKKIFYK